MGNFSELDMYLFGQSTHYDIYKKFGAHLVTENRKKGTRFTVWAPNAKNVWVVGSFNDWNETSHPMEVFMNCSFRVYRKAISTNT